MKEKEREIVVPGEVIASNTNLLPGEGTRREGKELVASRFGLVEKTERIVKIIPLSGVYTPKVGNIVIGKILDVTWNGWIVDIRAPQFAFLPLTECGKYVKKDLTDYYTFGDMILAQIKLIKARSIDLTMKGRGLRKLEDGLVLAIKPARVPRVIGKRGSMIELIKKGTNCAIIVGQNGLIWIKGKAKNELVAKEAIEIVVEKPFLPGLTEKIKKFLEEKNVQKT